MKSRKQTTPELDRLVREALEPNAAAVTRTVTGALRGNVRRSSISWIAAAAGAVALTAILLILRSPESAVPTVPSAHLAPRIFVISNDGDLVMVTTPDGARFFVGKRGS